MKVMHVLRI